MRLIAPIRHTKSQLTLDDIVIRDEMGCRSQIWPTMLDRYVRRHTPRSGETSVQKHPTR